MDVYPPAPWHLRAEFVVGVFLVPTARLPADVVAHAPAGARILRIGRRAVVGVAAVRYGPGGALEYDELLVAVPVREGARWRVTIPQIWVTSPASRAGGRAMWAIPKQLMSTHRAARAVRFRDAAGRPLATVTARAVARVPGRWSLPLTTAQRLDGADVVSRSSVRGRLLFACTSWAFDGELAWLAGTRTIASAAITEAAVTFGSRVSPPAPPSA